MKPRRDRRFRISVPIYVNLGKRVFNKQIVLESRDLSAGGLSFDTSRELPIDSTSRVLVSRIGDLSSQARIAGRIAWIRRLDDGRFRVGIEFTNFRDISRDELLARIERWEQSQSTPNPPAPVEP